MCQMHTCGTYCMRSSNTINTRFCRAGCGFEKTKLKCDTPGFSNIEEPRIYHDKRGFSKLELRRDDVPYAKKN